MDPRDWREFRPCDAVVEMHLVLGDRDAHSALWADSKRGYRWPCPRPHMRGNYLNINHKKCKFLYDREQQQEEFLLALEELTRCYLRVIQNFCTKLLGGSGGHRTPGDVAQDVFLKAYQAMPRFERNAPVRDWLFAIARTECYQALRNYGTRKRLRESYPEAIAQTVHTAASQTPEEELVHRADEEWTQERLALLPSSLSKLRKRQQELLTMRYIAGVPVADIAKKYFCSEAAIRTRLTDALKALRTVQEKAERARRSTPHGGL